jgi:fibro-slime domain-containing protein
VLFVASLALPRCGGDPVVSGTPPSGIGTGGSSGKDSGSGGTRASGGTAGTSMQIPVGDAGMSGHDAGGEGGAAEVAATCGDGLLNQAFEVCDDGNAESSDGCTADCRQLEANYACPTPGEPCVSTVKCGDGKITGSETCDDGNARAGDGCDHSCQLEDGYSCPFQGLACEASECGDGVLAGLEECEWDPKDARPEGCSDSCKIEASYDCDPKTFACRATECGNGKVERGEQCDDGNGVPFDGCYQCLLEPECANGVCTAICGDGQRFEGEECDDGNTRSGDGCSTDCKLETGFECEDVSSEPPDSILQPVLVRDFIGVDRSTDKTAFPEHPDFNRLTGSGTLGEVESELDDDDKPVYACPNGDCDANPGHQQVSCVGSSPCRPNLSTPENFAEWYRDVEHVNIAVPSAVPLARQAGGEYLYDSADTAADGKNYFDPIGSGGWVGQGGETLAPCGAKSAPDRNVSFTSETHFWFEYQGGERFDFAGDDDTWVFVNGQLAIDIGGLHVPKSGYFVLDDANGSATVWSQVEQEQASLDEHVVDLGLTMGGIYEVAMFQAERNECGSNFKVTLKNFNRPKSTCASVCGDGIVASDELCDDGPDGNDGKYGHCGKDCRSRGPYCGDGRQDAKEDCDDGVNLSQYGGCAPGCVLGPVCGDGIVQSPYEQCDDGTNDGGYGECFPGCVFKDRCGDGKVQAPEACDDGNRSNDDGCNNDCKTGVVR